MPFPLFYTRSPFFALLSIFRLRVLLNWDRDSFVSYWARIGWEPLVGTRTFWTESIFPLLQEDRTQPLKIFLFCFVLCCSRNFASMQPPTSVPEWGTLQSGHAELAPFPSSPLQTANTATSAVLYVAIRIRWQRYSLFLFQQTSYLARSEIYCGSSNPASKLGTVRFNADAAKDRF